MKRFLAVASLLIATSAPAAIVRIRVDDMIHAMTDEFIARALDEAAAQRADAVLIELSTPGGLDEATRSIVQKIIKSPVPVIVYVTPAGSRAASAGFFILESADVAAMAPGTNTGSAHPVLFGEKLDDVMKMKLQNDAAAFMRSIVAQRGRNVAAAEAGVREAKSFSDSEALTQKVIDIVAPDVPTLLRNIDGRTVKRFNGSTQKLHTARAVVRTIDMTLKQRLLSFIMNPNIAFILMSLGMLALWAEFNHPGAIVPGVVGLISILLAVFALNLLPTRYSALVLILVALALFALEAKFTTHGVLGIGGAICMTIGALLLVDGPIPEMRVNVITALSVSIPFAIIAVFLMTLVLRARKAHIATGSEGMVGEVGVARTPVGAEGKVFVHGELWNAMSGVPISEGARVRVRAVDGLRVVVEPAE
ncbi:MAG TPA: nodulation protein NfeD [Thermoanaerobaculia bacterium]|jgi:membrane-bound serine protease (ClpP class)|nr:nodulation protein NfeD [Thermoanaerobaculia bacterium]